MGEWDGETTRGTTPVRKFHFLGRCAAVRTAPEAAITKRAVIKGAAGGSCSRGERPTVKGGAAAWGAVLAAERLKQRMKGEMAAVARHGALQWWQRSFHYCARWWDRGRLARPAMSMRQSRGGRAVGQRLRKATLDGRRGETMQRQGKGDEEEWSTTGAGAVAAAGDWS
ncbi:hypothetical protein B296_00058164 [Ensete ventricosum]|uniref:Uncharacterized protein n=1 Tax=Ensete ventricosum TaxID=4639 RepID=A0A426XFJ8_ENSVE|nr:hypothetical protein B296_00058164 [Ensete ventricosum]